MDDAQLRTIWHQRQSGEQAVHLSQALSVLMKRNLGKRVNQLGKLAKIWDEVLPEPINEHTALEGFNNGVLTVMVDSASWRFELQMLLAAGLTKEIQNRFPGTLNKIRVVPGQFRSVDPAGGTRYAF
jgi:predicted nucleic acid-binding Zn ribbon protein